MSKPRDKDFSEVDRLMAEHEQSDYHKQSTEKFKAMQRIEPKPTDICAHCGKPLGKNGLVAIDTPYHRSCYFGSFKDE
jgi:RNA polymerase-binding transcription factor DksA